MKKEGISPGLLRRLAKYLEILLQARKAGRAGISSLVLSGYTGINAAQIRRDLALVGKSGKRGVGYDVDTLILSIKDMLNLSEERRMALVGAGNLAAVIVDLEIMKGNGFTISAVFDADPANIGRQIGELTVGHIADLSRAVINENLQAAILTVPVPMAQMAAETVAEAGIKIIFNFTQTLVDLPGSVSVHQLNPAGNLLYEIFRQLS